MKTFKSAFTVFIVLSLLSSCSKTGDSPTVTTLPTATLSATVAPVYVSKTYMVTVNSDTDVFNGLDVYVSWTDSKTALTYIDTLANITSGTYRINGSMKAWQKGYSVSTMAPNSDATNVKITGFKYYSNDLNFKY